MLLPLSLQQEIDRALESCSKTALQEARRALTDRYRQNDSSYFMNTDLDRLSYIATRMPATFAVCHQVLNHLSAEHSLITSLLDLGAGPGTVLWAARDLFPNLKHIMLIEKDRALAEQGKALFDQDFQQKDITFVYQDVQEASSSFKSHDLVTLSYMLGEIPEKDRSFVLHRAWEAARYFMAIVEPGTPEGFERLKKARQELIDQGAFIVAPCPHNKTCPITPQDWCHFSQRLSRSHLHRKIKESSLPYEDEKYSYIIASRVLKERPPSRIVKRPQHGSGHFLLDLCTEEGLKRRIISKRTPDLYRATRHLAWGDPGPESHES